MASKLTSQIKLRKLRSSFKRKHKRVVFTNGCFDILHAGHVHYLEKAKSFGDILIIGLNADRSVRRLKGAGRPINNQLDRAKVLSALACVDVICYFNEDTPLNLIKRIQPDVLVKGADWKKNEIVGAKEVKAAGGRVERIQFLKGRSTSATAKKISKLG